MKHYILWIWLLCFACAVNAQQVKVLDRTDLQPVEQAAISSAGGPSVFTNKKGEASIDALSKTSLITIQLIGYEPLTVSYEELQKNKFRILLTAKNYDVEEVVVSASKFEEKKKDVPQQIQIIKANDLAFMNQQTTADVLQQSGNVNVQKSQTGGGSPVIRGFEANKVLLVVDGVRMNNAIYRGGHLQNAITVDNAMLDRTEIVFGPGSVIYGSDALGGVVHFFTKRPVLSDSGIYTSVNAFTRYATANTEKTGHFDLNIGGKKFASLTSFTYSDFGDLRQGNSRNPFYGDFGKRFYYQDRINGIDTMIANDDMNIQKETGYTQYDLMQKFLFQQNKNVSHLLNIQYSTSTDIPRYDRLTEVNGNGVFRSAQWYYGPQERLFTSYTLGLDNANGMYDHSKIILAFQDIEESRHNRNFGSSGLNHRTENINVFSLNADFDKMLGIQELRYGIEGVYNDVKSTATRENVNTGAVTPLDTRYPDGGSQMTTLAAYITSTTEFGEKFIMSGGVRLNSVQLQSKFEDKTFFPFPFDEITQQSTAVNGNIGLVYMPGYDWRFSIVGSTGFRAPNVDDLAKIFESTKGDTTGTGSTVGTIIVPNPDLEPEYTYNAELGISKTFDKKITVEGVGYYSIFNNAIVTKNSTFNGQEFITYGDTLARVQMNVNEKEAYIYGLSGSITANITNQFSIFSTLNYTYGRMKTDTTEHPLDHIPPMFGKTGVNLNLKKFRAEFFVMYNGWKRLKDYNLEGEDNLQYATTEGMPGWYTLNVRGSYQLNQYVQVQAAVENIADQNYRMFASGVSAPGRNLILTLRGRF
jgi:hemoglobin/transferrin/lactoferrin receptor protein